MHLIKKMTTTAATLFAMVTSQAHAAQVWNFEISALVSGSTSHIYQGDYGPEDNPENFSNRSFSTNVSLWFLDPGPNEFFKTFNPQQNLSGTINYVGGQFTGTRLLYQSVDSVVRVFDTDYNNYTIFHAPTFSVRLVSITDPDAPVVQPVPEPATWAMLLAGFGAVGMAMRRRRQTVSWTPALK